MKNIIITGAASEVGKTDAKELINKNLILIDINKENINNVFIRYLIQFNYFASKFFLGKYILI